MFGITWMMDVFSLPEVLSTAGDCPPNVRKSNSSLNVYKLSTFVGFRHPVTALQLSFSAGSIVFACVDISHTLQCGKGIFYSKITKCKCSGP